MRFSLRRDYAVITPQRSVACKFLYARENGRDDPEKERAPAWGALSGPCGDLGPRCKCADAAIGSSTKGGNGSNFNELVRGRQIGFLYATFFLSIEGYSVSRKYLNTREKSLMTALIIAEKPSVAADIATALGGFRKAGRHWEKDGLIVTSLRGHLVEIAVSESEDPGFDLARLPVIPEAFLLKPIAGASDELRALQQLASRPDVDLLINACDAGREGELIFRRAVTYVRAKQRVERMWLQTMTAVGIKEAFQKRRTGDSVLPLAAAAKSRAEADWLIGINATRALTKANFIADGDLVSAGRIQTPTLAMLVDRELTIRTFVPRAFWQVISELGVAAGSWEARWINPDFKPNDDSAQASDRLFDKAAAEAIVAKCRGIAPTSVVDTATPESRKAPKLFDLTSLQREANTRLGFSASRTLEIAQALYEQHKVLTYPRTNSNHLPEDYPDTVKSTLGSLPEAYKNFAETILQNGWVTQKHSVFDNAKISDHFAIIPTGKAPSGLSRDEEALFDLVTRRFLAAFFPAAEFLKTTRVAIIAGQRFEKSGSVMSKPGWMTVYGGAVVNKGETEEAKLPAMTKGEPVANKGVRAKEGKTTPPQRFTEATLLAAMETAGRLVEDSELAAAIADSGLGTPATRANTIEELLSAKKGYAQRQAKYLVPTDKAIRLIQALREIGLDQLTSPVLTGTWEARLSAIEKRSDTRESFMRDIAQATQDVVDRIRARAVPATGKPRGGPGGGKPPSSSFNCNCGKAKLDVRPKSWTCPACGLTIWKEISQRQTREDDVKALCAKGVTEELGGFVSRNNGRSFSARLRVTGQKVEFAFEERSPSQAPEAVRK